MVSGPIEGAGGGAGPVQGPQGQISTELSLEQLLAQDWDAITLSQSQAELLEHIEQAGIPLLSMPWPVAVELLNYMMVSGGGADALNFLSSVENKFAEIGGGIWDKYLEHLREAEDRRAAFMNSAAYQQFLEVHSPIDRGEVERGGTDMMVEVRSSQEYMSYLQTLPPDQRAREIALTREYTLTANLVEASDNFDGRANTVALGAFMITAMTIPTLAAVDQIGHFPVPAAEVAAILDPSLQNTAVLTVNLFAQMVALPTATKAAMLAVGEGNGKQQMGKDFARTFARGILKLLGEGISKGTQVDAAVKAMAGNVGGAENAAVIAKIMLIAPSLALLYNSGIGWNAGAEFLGVIDGMPDFLGQGPEEATLAGLLRGYLAMLPPELREKTRSSLHSYFSKKPSLKELTNPVSTLSSALRAEHHNILEA